MSDKFRQIYDSVLREMIPRRTEELSPRNYKGGQYVLTKPIVKRIRITWDREISFCRIDMYGMRIVSWGCDSCDVDNAGNQECNWYNIAEKLLVPSALTDEVIEVNDPATCYSVSHGYRAPNREYLCGCLFKRRPAPTPQYVRNHIGAKKTFTEVVLDLTNFTRGEPSYDLHTQASVIPALLRNEIRETYVTSPSNVVFSITEF